MTIFSKAYLEQPVFTADDLVNYLKGGAKPIQQWGVGAEMEKLVVDSITGKAASFDRIETLLDRLADKGDWQRIYGQGRLISLRGLDSSVTLEPGGQLELSGALCPDLYCCHGDFCHYVGEVLTEAESLGLLILGLGVQPFSTLQEISWLPKIRYDIMRSYMPRAGDMGERMMKQSAGLQVNLDFADEEDCIDKLRVSQWLTPLFYALFANSPIMDGRPTGFLSTRGEIWSRTDPDRTGLLLQLFRKDAGLATYVEYALDVPMYFISRDEQLLDMTAERFSFRRYMAEGFRGNRALLADWDLHLSTLFPEVRLRPQLELRSADSLPPHLALSVAALAKGLLYDDEARQTIQKLFQNLSLDEFMRIYRHSWRFGLKTVIGSGTLQDVALDALTIAREGLIRQQSAVQGREDETRFLDGITEIAESGITLAQRLLLRWSGTPAEKLAVLREHCGFTTCE